MEQTKSADDLWWLSFVNEDGGGKACVVSVSSPSTVVDAAVEAYRQGANPGGQVVGVLVPRDKHDVYPEGLRNKLMTAEEWKQHMPIVNTKGERV